MTRLSLQSRILIALSALLLAGTFVLPLWKIELHAPQYPEGIGMLIRLDTLTGIKPADLDNLNGLNHYIGMKAISSDAFPALTIMPWVAGILAVLALVVSVIGRRLPLVVWLGGVALAGIAGFAEFYRWSYRYGHDLAPDAIIKVPGMSYQPPLLGTKQLLNFTATSWPDAGGWCAVAAFVFGVIALLPLLRPHTLIKQASSVAASVVPVTAMIALLLIGAACAPSPIPAIAYGKADCAVCQMRIVDKRFGGAAVTAKGKIRQFESIECLANYAITATGLQSVWVSNFDDPGTLVDATAARFVRRNGPAGEMGGNLLAVSSATDTASLRRRFGVAALSWADVQQLAESDQLTPTKVAGKVHAH